VLLNVRDVDRSRGDSDLELQSAVAAASADLGRTGRVLLRPSGTEPVVRVMVEAPTKEQCEAVCGRVAAVVERELGQGVAA